MKSIARSPVTAGGLALALSGAVCLTLIACAGGSAKASNSAPSNGNGKTYKLVQFHFHSPST